MKPGVDSDAPRSAPLGLYLNLDLHPDLRWEVPPSKPRFTLPPCAVLLTTCIWSRIFIWSRPWFHPWICVGKSPPLQTRTHPRTRRPQRQVEIPDHHAEDFLRRISRQQRNVGRQGNNAAASVRVQTSSARFDCAQPPRLLCTHKHARTQHTHAHTRTHTRTHSHTGTHTEPHTSLHTRTHTNTHTEPHTHTCARTHTRTHAPRQLMEIKSQSRPRVWFTQRWRF